MGWQACYPAHFAVHHSQGEPTALFSLWSLSFRLFYACENTMLEKCSEVSALVCVIRPHLSQLMSPLVACSTTTAVTFLCAQVVLYWLAWCPGCMMNTARNGFESQHAICTCELSFYYSTLECIPYMNLVHPFCIAAVCDLCVSSYRAHSSIRYTFLDAGAYTSLSINISAKLAGILKC